MSDLPPARPVTFFVAASLDGFLAREDGSVDWLFDDADYGYTPFYAGVDTLFAGRATYEASLAFPQYPYAGKRVFVFSRSRAGEVDAHGTVFTGERPGELVARLRQEKGRGFWLVGGGQLARSFLEDDVVDRIDLFVHPIVLGAGRPLFPRSGVSRAFSVEDVELFSSGLVRLSYVREPRS